MAFSVLQFKSCSSLEKAYYTPVEAALRWCNLIAHEVLILERVGLDVLPGVGMFPQWPCLRVNAERFLMLYTMVKLLTDEMEKQFLRVSRWLSIV